MIGCKLWGVDTSFLLRRLTLIATCSVLLASVICAQEVTHKIVFTFSYDFRQTPACSHKIKQACVQQFNFYDISHGTSQRVKLGSIPTPAHAKGFVKNISGTSDAILFNPGHHMVAVAAQMPDGSESDLRRCTTIVKIP
ncbi:MAG: hypothetical protein WBL50_11740 [Candidatus Acidiferrum sp.]